MLKKLFNANQYSKQNIFVSLGIPFIILYSYFIFTPLLLKYYPIDAPLEKEAFVQVMNFFSGSCAVLVVVINSFRSSSSVLLTILWAFVLWLMGFKYEAIFMFLLAHLALIISLFSRWVKNT